jgi:hypothetical protein
MSVAAAIVALTEHLDLLRAVSVVVEAIEEVLRPRSVECWPEYQNILSMPACIGRGWVRFPGTPQRKARRASH